MINRFCAVVLRPGTRDCERLLAAVSESAVRYSDDWNFMPRFTANCGKDNSPSGTG